MIGECPDCAEPEVTLFKCADCENARCAICLFGPELVCHPCYQGRTQPQDDRAALRWFAHRQSLGDAPSPEHRAELLQRGLITPSGAGLVLTDAGRALLDTPLCPTSREPAEDCGHLDADEDVELGGEGGFA